jgi:hypothetical protein
VLGAATMPNAEGKLEAAAAAAAPDAEAAKAAAPLPDGGACESQTRRRLIWRLNDFPYYYEPGVEHHLLWCTEPLPIEEVDRLASERFGSSRDRGDNCDANGNGNGGSSPHRRQHLIFVNPAPLQSVLAVWHAHVLVRSEPPPKGEED